MRCRLLLEVSLLFRRDRFTALGAAARGVVVEVVAAVEAKSGEVNSLFVSS